MNYDNVTGVYDYISFDIYDTLIKRNVAEPTDVFRLVELAYHQTVSQDVICNFHEKRRWAEIQARISSDMEEITLDEIYEVLTDIYGRESAQRLKEIEIQTELDVCVANHRLLACYQRCIDEGKTVILLSDMYLSQTVIEAMLSKNGITGYKKLYLSSNVRLRKGTGNLFRYALKDQGIQAKQLVHIGDNKRSDFFRPFLLGIKAAPLATQVNDLNYYAENGLNKKDLFSYRTFSSYINNHITQNENPYWKIGFEVLGPLVYGFSKWLLQEVSKKNIKKVFFLARDGYLLQKAFDIMNDTDDIQSSYLYVSRRSLVLPAICSDPQWSAICRFSIVYSVETVRELLDIFDLAPAQYVQTALHHGLHLDSKINVLKNQNQILSFYDAIKEDVISSSEKAYGRICSYFEQAGFADNLAIVDLGWMGGMQHAICSISRLSDKKINVSGYYMGIHPESVFFDSPTMKGFLFQPGRNAKLGQKVNLMAALVETMFMAPHGSAKKYETDKDGCVHPVLTPCEFSEPDGRLVDEISILSDLHEGALTFIRGFHASAPGRLLPLSSAASFQSFTLLGTAPKNKDLHLLGKIRFHNIQSAHLIECRPYQEYFRNPFKLILDIRRSYWRIGYLKSLLKLPLPYTRIYLFAKRIFSKQ